MRDHGAVYSSLTWPWLVRLSPASENMEINVNLASGSEEAYDGHLQIYQQPLTTTEM